MLAKFSGVESERTASKFRIIIKKNKKQLQKQKKKEVLCRGRASTGTKCIQNGSVHLGVVY